MRITWKRQASETGLRRVVQGPRGWDLRIDKVRVGGVYPRLVGYHRYNGWRWLAGSTEHGIDHRHGGPHAIPDDAKAECMAYVRACLAARKT